MKARKYISAIALAVVAMLSVACEKETTEPQDDKNTVISLVGTKWARYWVNDFGGRYGDYKWYNYDTLYFVNNEEYILFAHLTDQEEENPYEQSYVRSAGYYFDGMSEGYIYSGPDYQLEAHFQYRPDKIIFNTSSNPATRPIYYRVEE